jgi:hypothetical protein
MNYRAVLQYKLKEKKWNNRDIAKDMGWKSSSTVSFKLNGQRDWSDDELARMSALAGMTVVELAAASDDMPNFFRRPESAEGAILLDRLPEKEFNAVMSLLRAL